MFGLGAYNILLTGAFLLSFGTAQGIQPYVVPKTNNPAQMSTQYAGSQNAQLVMDGNNDGNYIRNVQCIHTDVYSYGALTWWLVDMLKNYLVYSVTVWNRNNGPGRFTQITVGVTLDSSVWTNFNAALFSSCAYYGKVPSITDNPIGLNCTRPLLGRYLALIKNNTGNDGVLTICEVDIYATNSKNQLPYIAWNVEPTFSNSSTSHLFNAAITARSHVECFLECSKYPECVFILYDSGTVQCWLFRSSIINTSFLGVLNSPGATFMSVTDA